MDLAPPQSLAAQQSTPTYRGLADPRLRGGGGSVCHLMNYVYALHDAHTTAHQPSAI